MVNSLTAGRGSASHAAVGSSLDIVVPVLNERATVEPLIARLRAAVPDARMIFVDNGSTDGTREWLAAQPGVTLIAHGGDLGYGASMLDGFAAGDGAHVVMIDADLEYHPEDIPALVAALDRAHVVYGSRFLDRTLQSAPMPWARAAGNRLVSGVFGVCFGQRLSDLYTGLRGVRREVLDRITLRTTGFDFVVELAAQAARAGLTLGEIPIHYTPRALGTSKMHHARELLRFIQRTARLWVKS